VLKLLLAIPLALAVGYFASAGMAQQGGDKGDARKIEDVRKQDPVPPATGSNPAEQAGTAEPSAKTPVKSENVDAFANGVLTAPNAPRDVDTAPAKFSERTNAHDQIPIAGYRLFNMTEEQKRDVARELSAAGAAAISVRDAYAVVGAEIPAPIVLALRPLPEALSQRHPELDGTGVISAGTKLLIVDMDNSRVVGVIEG